MRVTLRRSKALSEISQTKDSGPKERCQALTKLLMARTENPAATNPIRAFVVARRARKVAKAMALLTSPTKVGNAMAAA
jgi:hypothetical protein